MPSRRHYRGNVGRPARNHRVYRVCLDIDIDIFDMVETLRWRKYDYRLSRTFLFNELIRKGLEEEAQIVLPRDKVKVTETTSPWKEEEEEVEAEKKW